MLSGLLYWLNPARRRFMRKLAKPALTRFKANLQQAGAPWARGFITILLDANAEYLAYALSERGPLASYRDLATTDTVEACLGSLLLFSLNLFAREDFARNESALIPTLAHTLGLSTAAVMLRRDALRKTPRSEEWMLYSWLVKALGASTPAFDSGLERSFGYQYLSYIGQYQTLLEKSLMGPVRAASAAAEV